MFSGIIAFPYPSLSFISSIALLIPLSSILYIPFISFLRFSSTFINYEIHTMSVRILVITLSFAVLIENTLGQLDITANASDVWFESSSIDRWGNSRMRTWGLKGVRVLEAVATETNSAGCALHNIYLNQPPIQYSQVWLFQYSGNCTDRLCRMWMKEDLFTHHLDISLRIVIVFL